MRALLFLATLSFAAACGPKSAAPEEAVEKAVTSAGHMARTCRAGRTPAMKRRISGRVTTACSTRPTRTVTK